MNPSVDQIIAASAKHYNVLPLEVKSSRKARHLVRARHVVAFLAACMTDRSRPQIGREMGGFDPSTILHAERKIAEELQQDASLKADVDTIAAQLAPGGYQLEPAHVRAKRYRPTSVAVPRQDEHKLNVLDILTVVAVYYCVNKQEVIGPGRQHYIVAARFAVIWLAMTLSTHSLPHIGKMLGGRHSSTIDGAARKFARELQHDPEIASAIAELTTLLTESDGPDQAVAAIIKERTDAARALAPSHPGKGEAAGPPRQVAPFAMDDKQMALETVAAAARGFLIATATVGSAALEADGRAMRDAQDEQIDTLMTMRTAVTTLERIESNERRR